MMIVMGNGSSFLGRYLERFFTPVANTIGLNTTWNFFSPDPAHTMYLKYDIFFEDAYGNSLKDVIEGYYPPSKDLGGDFRLDLKRDSYVMRFVIVDPARIPTFFIPWLCKKNPGASKVQVEIILNRIPSLDQVMAVVHPNLKKYENLSEAEEISRFSFECAHAG